MIIIKRILMPIAMMVILFNIQCVESSNEGNYFSRFCFIESIHLSNKLLSSGDSLLFHGLDSLAIHHFKCVLIDNQLSPITKTWIEAKLLNIDTNITDNNEIYNKKKSRLKIIPPFGVGYAYVVVLPWLCHKLF